jgi:hypothetical protein
MVVGVVPTYWDFRRSRFGQQLTQVRREHMFLGHMALTVTQMAFVAETAENGAPSQGNMNVRALFMVVVITGT